uniref:ATPase AAA-type core domain-containing protein n=1 Tax=Romanomermis culicivorax TaxID=13658 RepID=A0A915J168_ROMCU
MVSDGKPGIGLNRLVSQLLAEMDGVHSSNDVFVIGATNRVDLVDKSLLRPGRFDQTILVDAAVDASSRFNILSAVTRRLPLSANVDLVRLTAQCPPRMTGADFYWLARQAAMNAASRLVKSLSVENHVDRDNENDEHDLETRVENTDFLTALASISESTNGHEVGL